MLVICAIVSLILLAVGALYYGVIEDEWSWKHRGYFLLVLGCLSALTIWLESVAF